MTKSTCRLQSNINIRCVSWLPLADRAVDCAFPGAESPFGLPLDNSEQEAIVSEGG